MQGRYPEDKIILNGSERRKLKKIANSRTVEFRLVQRAKIILLASEGRYRNTEIGEKVDCNRDTVRMWRKRFNESRLDGLKDLPRSGHPPKFTAQERAGVLAMATKNPRDEGRHFDVWSARELAKHVMKKSIVSSISYPTVHRWLKGASIKPHKWEYWLNSTDPEFSKKNEENHRTV